jgi:hypothetical protein
MPAAGVVARLPIVDAVWNTGISTGPVTAYWDLARTHLREHVDQFEHYIDETGWDWSTFEDDYGWLPPASAADLFGQGRGLAVIPLDT